MRKILEKLEVLKKVFGYDSFREGQEKIIDAILRGQDVLGIMPTGAGKSIRSEERRVGKECRSRWSPYH